MRMLGIFLLLSAVIFLSCQSNSGTALVASITDSQITLTNGEVIPLPADTTMGVSTLFLIRHAEKENNGQTNPPLSINGKVQAKVIDSLFANVKLAAILSTSFERNMETARPIAESKKIPITNYNPGENDPILDYALKFEKGKKFLIIGHSNTIPELVLNLVPNSTPFTIAEDEYDGLYVITSDGLGSSKVYALKYKPF